MLVVRKFIKNLIELILKIKRLNSTRKKKTRIPNPKKK